jgi:hypothetical protein
MGQNAAAPGLSVRNAFDGVDLRLVCGDARDAIATQLECGAAGSIRGRLTVCTRDAGLRS